MKTKAQDISILNRNGAKIQVFFKIGRNASVKNYTQSYGSKSGRRATLTRFCDKMTARSFFIMGQVVIEVPQNINLKVSVKSAEIVDEILRLVKSPKKKLETIALDLPDEEYDSKQIWADYEDSDEMPVVIPPRRNNLKEDGEAVLGIWADRKESAEEIARKIRDRNNGKI